MAKTVEAELEGIATTDIAKAMYRALLNASESLGARASVFRVDTHSGRQYFFSTCQPASHIGHMTAAERIPDRERASHLTHVCTVTANRWTEVKRGN